MKKTYLLSRILITVLISFLAAAYLGAVTAANVLTDSDVYTGIIRDNGLGQKVYDSLEDEFEKQYNTTAVPADVFMNSLSAGQLEDEMCGMAAHNASVLAGAENSYAPDFSALEADIDKFFSEYAEQINYEPDEAYEQKLAETKKNAEKLIEERMDAFYMNSLREKGYFEKVQRYIPYLNFMTIALLIIIIGAVLYIAFREQGSVIRKFYWQGAAFFCGGAMLAVPCGYLLFSGKLGSFAVKVPVVYTAVTNLLETGVTRVFAKAAAALILGLVIVIWNAVKIRKDAAAQSSAS